MSKAEIRNPRQVLRGKVAECDYDCGELAIGLAESEGVPLAHYCQAHKERAYIEFGGDAEFWPIPPPSKETHG